MNLVDPEGLCRKNGESRSACAERVAKEVLGDKLEILDDFGYWGLGTGALSATFGNSLFKKAVDKGADKFIKNSQIAGADTDGDMFAKKAASRKAAREAGKIASKRAALAAISKYSGILGLGATGGSGMMRALGYYFGECDKEWQCE